MCFSVKAAVDVPNLLQNSNMCLEIICLDEKIFVPTGRVVASVHNYPVKVSQDVFSCFMVNTSLPV